MNLFGPILFFIVSQLSITNMDVNSLGNLASENISLEKRYDDKFVNSVFKDNILLNVHYLAGKVAKKEEINWDEIGKPINYSFTLLPDQTFAFHEDVLPKYENSVVKTTNAHFNFSDGFKSDGYLMGDGVCHLASLIYWAARQADLDAYAPTNHNFAVIPQIEREYGVSIYMAPGAKSANAMQNLYITNNKINPVKFEFKYDNGILTVSVKEAGEIKI